MAHSDATDPIQRRRWPPGRMLPILYSVLVVATVLALAWYLLLSSSFSAHFGSDLDDRRFDELETEFERDHAAFLAAEKRMRELVAAHPDAARIGWSLSLICVRDPNPTTDDACDETGTADQALFEALPDVDVVVHQGKDDGLLFFRFFANDPPDYTIMLSSRDVDPLAFANDRGFRAARELEPGWAILGPIEDIDRADEQWP
jgi:hypothetical protein